METLPIEIYRYLSSFVTDGDYRCFLNSSKRLFAEIKKRIFVFRLNKSKSRKYLIDESFRRELLELVENGWRQIHLILRYPLPPIEVGIPIYQLTLQVFPMTELTFLDNCEALKDIAIIDNAMFENKIPSLYNVKQLSISKDKNVTELSPLSHLSRLSIRSTTYVNTDVTPLQSIPDLCIFDCRMIKSFRFLENRKQNRLRLYHCPALTEVTAFSHLSHLRLVDCPNLKDISPLRGIPDLSFQNCCNVQDISVLGGHRRLSICVCAPSLIGYDVLMNIATVTLDKCDITDLSVLKHAKSVSLSRCMKVTDLSPLSSVPDVSVFQCPNATNSLQSLRYVNRLYANIDQFFQQEQLTFANHSLSIDGYISNPENIVLLPDIQFLDTCQMNIVTHYFSKPENHGALRNLYKLSLQSVDIIDTNGMGQIPHLTLSFCYKLVDISALGRNRIVEIVKAPSLEDVSSLSTVLIVTIKYCDKVKDYSCLSQVPRLKIEHEEKLV